MRVLVTGGAGFAGRHLLHRLLRDGGHAVTATSLGGVPDHAEDAALAAGGVRWLPLDVTSPASVRAAVEESTPEWVFHLAGQASVGASFQDPLGTWDVNATGTLRLLEALRRQGGAARILVVSSAEVYGAVAERDQPIREDAPLRPITPYGASKAGAELLALQAAASEGLEVVVARSFNHVGPGQDERFVLASMARQLASMRDGAGPPVLRVGNLEVRRDFLDVRDVAAAYLRLIEAGESGAAYNVCSGEARSLRSIVEQMVTLSGTGARIEIDPERFRPADIPLLVGAAERLRGLGWRPEVPLDETLRDLLHSVAPR